MKSKKNISISVFTDEKRHKAISINQIRKNYTEEILRLNQKQALELGIMLVKES